MEALLLLEPVLFGVAVVLILCRAWMAWRKSDMPFTAPGTRGEGKRIAPMRER